MLVLSRKPDERIVIPALGIEICVVELRPGKVLLGFDAPTDIAILRGELAERHVDGAHAAADPEGM